MEYKVTLSKCREHLGESLDGLLLPWWKVPRMQKGLAFGILLVLGIAALLLSEKAYWPALAIVVISGIWLFPGLYQKLKERYKRELSQKIRHLINDPELLWLNFMYEKRKKLIQKIDFEWCKNDKPRVSETNVQVMSFLKAKGTSQGLHRVISGFQNSGSANKHLQRLAEKGLVKALDNEFEYVAWKFVLIDDLNKEIKDDKLRKLLSEAWEMMIDAEAQKWN